MFRKIRKALYSICDSLCLVAGYCDITTNERR